MFELVVALTFLPVVAGLRGGEAAIAWTVMMLAGAYLLRRFSSDAQHSDEEPRAYVTSPRHGWAVNGRASREDRPGS